MRRTGFGFLVIGLFLGISPAVASATVTEPSGLVVPINQALSNDYFDTRRYNANTLGIQTLLNTWEGTGAIDAYTGASSTTVSFSPVCGVSAALILRGGTCQVDFGWYCADDAPGSEVIHPLVLAADIVKYHDVTLVSTLPNFGKPPAPLNNWQELQNSDKAFVPTVQSGFLVPVAGTGDWTGILSSTEYLACPSRRIGFAFKGNPTSICPMSKFVDPARNPTSTFGAPWIHAVVYVSQKYPGSYYVAFEDLPTSATSFTPTLADVQSTYPQMYNQNNGWQQWKNDGDMNDFVYKVDGVLCDGGGKPCTPTDGLGNALKGACSFGITACAKSPGGTGTCQQKTQTTAEVCNGWDDDCNGIADDGIGLCPSGYVCDEGKCALACTAPEAPCDSRTVCETVGSRAGHCVVSKCQGVVCSAGRRCDEVTGTCVDGCEGVSCSVGQVCISGSCIDPCAGVSCSSHFVCERGVCIPSCACQPCTDATRSACDNVTGRCVDPTLPGTGGATGSGGATNTTTARGGATGTGGAIALGGSVGKGGATSLAATGGATVANGGATSLAATGGATVANGGATSLAATGGAAVANGGEAAAVGGSMAVETTARGGRSTVSTTQAGGSLTAGGDSDGSVEPGADSTDGGCRCALPRSTAREAWSSLAMAALLGLRRRRRAKL